MGKKTGPKGPTKMTSETIGKLEQAFASDMTDSEACFYAEIHPSTLYDYQKKNPEFLERKEALKNALSLHAKNNIARKIKDGDVQESKWWLERRRKDDFSTRNENTGKDGGPMDVLIGLRDAISNKSSGLPGD